MTDPAARPVHTIVSGLPRSGTTLMMQMLAAGGLPPLTDGVRAADEDNPRGYCELEAVKRSKTDASWLDDAVGRVVKVIHMLLADLPPDRDYRVVFMRRHLDEVVRSQRVMLDRRQKRGADLAADKMVELYEKQYRTVEAWLARQPNFRVLDVSYNDLLADPERVIDGIDAFLDGGLDVEAMKGAIDPSLYRQRSAGPG